MTPTVSSPRLGLKYWRRWMRRPPVPTRDVLYVVAAQNRGWVLDQIAHRLAEANHGRAVDVVYTGQVWPGCHVAFFTHPSLFLTALADGALPGRYAVVYVTHLPEEDSRQLQEIAYGIAVADAAVCMNSAVRDRLIALGVDPARLFTVPGAADPDVFRPSPERRAPRVLLSAAYYARKAPDALLGLVRHAPQERFRLVGRDWAKYGRFAELNGQPNFEYREEPYERYPGLYVECDVFLSLSTREGGPIPLLEAMFCDLVPVVTRTGFAPDVVRHGENGLLFEAGAAPELVRDLIVRARTLGSVRESALAYAWPRFAARVDQIVAPFVPVVA